MPVFAKSLLGPLIVGSERKVSNAVYTATRNVEAHGKDLAAVDTGHMKNTIKGRVSGFSGRVEVGADYGMYVEFGTSKMDAQPFMTPAAESQREPFEQAIAAAFR